MRATQHDKTVIFLGRDDFGFSRIACSDEPRDWMAAPLFEHSELQTSAGYPIEALLRRAETALNPMRGRICGITGYWDFPVTSMIPLLCARYGLPGPSLHSVLRCEHKYWARLCQRALIPEAVPDFRAVDPFADDLVERWDFGYPCWLKPIKAWSSQLGFRVESPHDLQTALTQIRQNIHRFAEPFNHVLDRARPLPDEIRAIDGQHCIAERIIAGRQCTLEGFVSRGRARTYALFDSVRYAGTSCFARYQYPSQLPREAKLRMVELAERLMEGIGYDQACFNIEFFWDESAGRAWLLEVNPRLSVSHADISLKVDGISNLERMAALAAGETPRLHKEAGPYRIAAKFMHRRFSDALVTRVPTPRELSEIEAAVPGTSIQLMAQSGARLSQLLNQDSYSYELAYLHIGADDEAELQAKYEACVRRMAFDFSGE